MCGRYTLARSQQELSERFGIKQLFIDFSPRYNIAPTQKVPVILDIDGIRSMDAYRWGLIPSWLKDIKTAKPLINARAETLAEKPSFKTALAKRRCLVPADGFYEWKTEGKVKLPMFIHRKDNNIIAFAGIWDEWSNEAGEKLRSFSIITTEANDAISKVHDRMPVILPSGAENAWLDPAMKIADLIPMLVPCPSELIAMHEVSGKVNSAKSESADMIDAVGTQLKIGDFA